MNIYLRIYKLYQRKIPIQQISATMNIPTKTIKDLIVRFEQKGAGKGENDIENITAPFLDYIVKKYHKYSVLDFSGMLILQFTDKIKTALEEAKMIPTQILAVKLESIIEIEDAAMKVIIDFKDKANVSGKNVVLLSPSDIVEDYIIKNDIEKDTKVFGTQSAFEEYTFKSVLDKTKNTK